MSASVIVIVLSLAVMLDNGYTAQEWERGKLHRKILKLEAKDQAEKKQALEIKKNSIYGDKPLNDDEKGALNLLRNESSSSESIPKWETSFQCYNYRGDAATEANSVSRECLRPNDFPDGSLIKGIVFDIGILILEILCLVFLYAWIMWLFEK